MKRFWWLILLIDAVVLSAAPISPARQLQLAGGSWLDHPLSNWNTKMGGLPRARPGGGKDGGRLCRMQVREPASAAERALVRAGWMLFGAAQIYDQTQVVTAMSGADGMCRPVGQQVFVYWEGRYAGSLAPQPMDSRSDGSILNVRLLGPAFIAAEFARYAERDPLCCPSRTSSVTYKLNRDEAPLITPTNVSTSPTCHPGEGGQAGNSSDNAADALFGKKWMLTEIRGNSVKAEPYIEFDREKGRFSGFGGCNRISGGFEVSDSNLTLSQVISTKMACLDAAANQTEADFLRELTGVLRFEIRDDVLRLYAGDEAVLTFKASSTEAGEGTPTAAVTGTVR
jgi:heat shock protein HslJ